MDDRFNTIAGWVLFAGIVALGSSIVAGELFHSERPEKMGYPIEGVAQEGEGGAAPEQPIEFFLAKADPAKGQQVFNKCMACHNAEKGGPNQRGPNLWGVIGEPIAQGKGGFAYGGFCGQAACEAEIKEQTGATIRVLPDPEFRSPEAPKTCMWCGKPSMAEAVWAQAY